MKMRTEIEDVVDFLLNKIDFRFSIEEPIIASNLQFMDRKMVLIRFI